jgi:hypothetical protein
VLYLDGIRYSIDMVDTSCRRLRETLERIARAGDVREVVAPLVVEAMIDSWTMIDATHRLRGLVQQLPGLKQNQPGVQLFVRKTRTVEELRNFVQHFRTEIDTFVAKRMPLWGTLSWSRVPDDTQQPECHSIVPGTLFQGTSVYSCIFDRHEGRFIDRIILEAGDARVDLEDLFDTVAAFCQWFEQWYLQAHPGEHRHVADVHLRVLMVEG